jgi:hypothetical protein
MLFRAQKRHLFCLHFFNSVTIYVCDFRQRFGLVIGIIDHLYTRHVSTRNYSTTANLHSSQTSQNPLKLSSLLCLHQPFPGNGFYQR